MAARAARGSTAHANARGRAQILFGTFARIHCANAIAESASVDAEARLLVLSDPDGFVEMIREAGTPAERRDLPPAAAPDFARLEAACARAGELRCSGRCPIDARRACVGQQSHCEPTTREH